MINSYHPTYPWSSDITAGFLEEIGVPGPEKRIAIEYLDWKNYPSGESLNLPEELIRFKYGTLLVVPPPGSHEIGKPELFHLLFPEGRLDIHVNHLDPLPGIL